MKFLNEILDPTSSQEETPLPQFKLNYQYEDEATPLAELGQPTPENTHLFFVRSMQYFQIKHKAVGKDNIPSINDLAIKIQPLNKTQSFVDHISAPPVTSLRSQNRQTASYFGTSTSLFSTMDHEASQFEGETQYQNLQKFNLDLHSHIVSDHVTIYKQRSTALVQLDLKILAALLTAIAAACVPFIPFMGLLSFTAWMATFYLLNQRADHYTAYQDALSLLVGTCNWALGANRRNRIDGTDQLATNQTIKSMMECLYPVLSKTQIEHFIADDIQETYSNCLQDYDKRFKFRFFAPQNENPVAQAVHHELESAALKQRGAEFIRCVYGLNRGTPKDFLRVALNALPDLWRAACNVTRALCTTPPEENLMGTGPASF